VGIVRLAHANGDGHQAELDSLELKLAMLASRSAEAAGQVTLTQWAGVGAIPMGSGLGVRAFRRWVSTASGAGGSAGGRRR
jgi:hypothetical protein